MMQKSNSFPNCMIGFNYLHGVPKNNNTFLKSSALDKIVTSTFGIEYSFHK